MLGLLLIALSWRGAWRQLGFNRKPSSEGALGDETYIRVENAPDTSLEINMPALKEPSVEKGGPPARSFSSPGWLREQPSAKEARPQGDFQEYLSRALTAPKLVGAPGESQVLPLTAIQEALEAGESIESVAKRFGRGKGEIELILNLRRAKG